MKNTTRVLYNTYLADQALLNGVPSVAQKFSVTPSIQQKLENRIQESSGFLQLVNIVPVDEMQGEKLALGVTGTIASRTDTTTQDRQTADVASLQGQGYQCVQTNYDTHVRYNTLDMWAKFPDFQLRLARAIQQQCALDRIMIGFNGTSAAATTNRTTSQLLQDVNKGWLKYLRDNAAARVMSQGAVAGKVTVGAAGDYKTLDGLVYDATQTLLDPWHAGAAAELAAAPGEL
ncbi:MAG TPA: phage major capsid protein, P2 family [Alicycliphilus sp.]|nr:phage major capsid protein, P2 family [Alicycliphilus sp.]